MANVQKMLDLSWWQHAENITQGAKCLMKKAMKAFIDSGDETMFWMEYGFEKDTCGCPDVRESLAKFLSNQYGDKVDKSTLVLNYGASHGLELLLGLVLHQKMPLFCQQPGFASAINQFYDTNQNIIPVMSDEHGIIPEKFEAALEKHFGAATTLKTNGVMPDTLPDRGAALYRGSAYLIPNFNNPTGSCLKIDRCRKVVALARKYNILLICDDVYNLFSYETDSNGDFTPIHPRLFQFDNRSDPDYGIGHVVSIGTFSKIFFPSSRLGWMEVPPLLYDYIERLGFTYSSGGINLFMSRLIKCVLDDGSLHDHLLKTRHFYKEQTVLFDNALKAHLHPAAVYSSPKGGFSFWITLPHHIKSAELLKMSEKKHNFSYLPGSMFSVTPGELDNCIRVCISNCPHDKLEWVAKCLNEDITEMLALKGPVANGKTA